MTCKLLIIMAKGQNLEVAGNRVRFPESHALCFPVKAVIQNNPQIPAGTTNIGITIATLSAWEAPRVSPEDVPIP